MLRARRPLLELRVAVFVVEQDCAFQDVDGADLVSEHLVGREEGTIVAYCRLVPPGAMQAAAAMTPDSRYLDIPRGGHAPFLGHADQVAGQVRDFLATLPPA